MSNPSQCCGASPAMWDHTVLRATRHRWTCHILIPARQAGTRFTYPWKDGRLSWHGSWLYTQVVYLSKLKRQSPVPSMY